MKKQLHIIRLLSCAVLCLSASTINAQYATDYVPGVSSEGAVYFLPKTAVDVTFTITKVTYTPGDLCKYADRSMHLSNVSDKEDVHFELTSVTLSYAPLADESKCYRIPFNTQSVAPNVMLSSEGTLLAINTDNPYLEEVALPEETKTENAIDTRTYMTEDMLMAGSKAKLAELAAGQIYEIRESRNALMKGESEYMPSDGAGLKIMTENLNLQEKALLQLFEGVTEREIFNKTVRIVPDDNISKKIIARFSHKLGLVDSDDLAGSPIFLDVKCQKEIPLRITTTEQATRVRARRYEGLLYNLPAKTDMKVYSSNRTYIESTTSLPQFGETEILSSRLFRKQNNTKVILDPINGALLKVEE